MTSFLKNRSHAFLGAIFMIGLFGGSALASDLPGRANPPAPAPDVSYLPSFDFSGIYSGAAFGANWLEQNHPSYTISLTPSPGAFGANIYGGYNYTIAPRAFVGGEVDAGWNNARSGFNIPANSGGSAKESWNGSIRGRLGYNVYGPVALYVLGGPAIADIATDVPSVGISKDDTKMGWILGMGADAFIMKDVQLRTEYTVSQFAGTPVANVGKTPALIDQSLKFGLSYKWY